MFFLLRHLIKDHEKISKTTHAAVLPQQDISNIKPSFLTNFISRIRADKVVTENNKNDIQEPVSNYWKPLNTLIKLTEYKRRASAVFSTMFMGVTLFAMGQSAVSLSPILLSGLVFFLTFSAVMYFFNKLSSVYLKDSVKNSQIGQKLDQQISAQQGAFKSELVLTKDKSGLIQKIITDNSLLQGVVSCQIREKNQELNEVDLLFLPRKAQSFETMVNVFQVIKGVVKKEEIIGKLKTTDYHEFFNDFKADDNYLVFKADFLRFVKESKNIDPAQKKYLKALWKSFANSRNTAEIAQHHYERVQRYLDNHESPVVDYMRLDHFAKYTGIAPDFVRNQMVAAGLVDIKVSQDKDGLPVELICRKFKASPTALEQIKKAFEAEDLLFMEQLKMLTAKGLVTKTELVNIFGDDDVIWQKLFYEKENDLFIFREDFKVKFEALSKDGTLGKEQQRHLANLYNKQKKNQEVVIKVEDIWTKDIYYQQFSAEERAVALIEYTSTYGNPTDALFKTFASTIEQLKIHPLLQKVLVNNDSRQTFGYVTLGRIIELRRVNARLKQYLKIIRELGLDKKIKADVDVLALDLALGREIELMPGDLVAEAVEDAFGSDAPRADQMRDLLRNLNAVNSEDADVYQQILRNYNNLKAGIERRKSILTSTGDENDLDKFISCLHKRYVELKNRNEIAQVMLEFIPSGKLSKEQQQKLEKALDEKFGAENVYRTSGLSSDDVRKLVNKLKSSYLEVENKVQKVIAREIVHAETDPEKIQDSMAVNTMVDVPIELYEKFLLMAIYPITYRAANPAYRNETGSYADYDLNKWALAQGGVMPLTCRPYKGGKTEYKGGLNATIQQRVAELAERMNLKNTKEYADQIEDYLVPRIEKKFAEDIDERCKKAQKSTTAVLGKHQSQAYWNEKLNELKAELEADQNLESRLELEMFTSVYKKDGEQVYKSLQEKGFLNGNILQDKIKNRKAFYEEIGPLLSKNKDKDQIYKWLLDIYKLKEEIINIVTKSLTEARDSQVFAAEGMILWYASFTRDIKHFKTIEHSKIREEKPIWNSLNENLEDLEEALNEKIIIENEHDEVELLELKEVKVSERGKLGVNKADIEQLKTKYGDFKYNTFAEENEDGILEFKDKADAEIGKLELPEGLKNILLKVYNSVNDFNALQGLVKAGAGDSVSGFKPLSYEDIETKLKKIIQAKINKSRNLRDGDFYFISEKDILGKKTKKPFLENTKWGQRLSDLYNEKRFIKFSDQINFKGPVGNEKKDKNDYIEVLNKYLERYIHQNFLKEKLRYGLTAYFEHECKIVNQPMAYQLVDEILDNKNYLSKFIAGEQVDINEDEFIWNFYNNQYHENKERLADAVQGKKLTEDYFKNAAKSDKRLAAEDYQLLKENKIVDGNGNILIGLTIPAKLFSNQLKNIDPVDFFDNPKDKLLKPKADIQQLIEQSNLTDKQKKVFRKMLTQQEFTMNRNDFIQKYQDLLSPKEKDKVKTEAKAKAVYALLSDVAKYRDSFSQKDRRYDRHFKALVIDLYDKTAKAAEEYKKTTADIVLDQADIPVDIFLYHRNIPDTAKKHKPQNTNAMMYGDYLPARLRSHIQNLLDMKNDWEFVKDLDGKEPESYEKTFEFRQELVTRIDVAGDNTEMFERGIKYEYAKEMRMWAIAADNLLAENRAEDPAVKQVTWEELVKYVEYKLQTSQENIYKIYDKDGKEVGEINFEIFIRTAYNKDSMRRRIDAEYATNADKDNWFYNFSLKDIARVWNYDMLTGKPQDNKQIVLAQGNQDLANGNDNKLAKNQTFTMTFWNRFISYCASENILVKKLFGGYLIRKGLHMPPTGCGGWRYRKGYIEGVTRTIVEDKVKSVEEVFAGEVFKKLQERYRGNSFEGWKKRSKNMSALQSAVDLGLTAGISLIKWWSHGKIPKYLRNITGVAITGIVLSGMLGIPLALTAVGLGQAVLVFGMAGLLWLGIRIPLRAAYNRFISKPVRRILFEDIGDKNQFFRSRIAFIAAVVRNVLPLALLSAAAYSIIAAIGFTAVMGTPLVAVICGAFAVLTWYFGIPFVRLPGMGKVSGKNIVGLIGRISLYALESQGFLVHLRKMWHKISAKYFKGDISDFEPSAVEDAATLNSIVSGGKESVMTPTPIFRAPAEKNLLTKVLQSLRWYGSQVELIFKEWMDVPHNMKAFRYSYDKVYGGMVDHGKWHAFTEAVHFAWHKSAEHAYPLIGITSYIADFLLTMFMFLGFGYLMFYGSMLFVTFYGLLGFAGVFLFTMGALHQSAPIVGVSQNEAKIAEDMEALTTSKLAPTVVLVGTMRLILDFNPTEPIEQHQSILPKRDAKAVREEMAELMRPHWWSNVSWLLKYAFPLNPAILAIFFPKGSKPRKWLIDHIPMNIAWKRIFRALSEKDNNAYNTPKDAKIFAVPALISVLATTLFVFAAIFFVPAWTATTIASLFFVSFWALRIWARNVKALFLIDAIPGVDPYDVNRYVQGDAEDRIKDNPGKFKGELALMVGGLSNG